MKQAFLGAFGEGIAGCIMETNELRINAYDCYECPQAEQRSYLVTLADQSVDFTLHNPSGQILVFAAIDNCILQQGDQARCDFIIGNFQKLFLVEVKRVNTGMRSSARKSAIHQLFETLVWLRAHLNLDQTELIAVINLKAKLAYPIQSARKAADRARFLTVHNADLVEGQEAHF